MFGYVSANLRLLTDEQRERYNACYCGLCYTLGKRHGIFSRMTLTYDMTFLVMLLNSLYEPEEKHWRDICPVHRLKPRPFWTSEITDYAADMNIALAYLNCMDNWQDDLNPVSLAEAKLMQRAYKRVCTRYPRQCDVIKASMARLKEIEDSGELNPDAASEAFGELMAELLVYKEDYWSDTLRALGMALGQFIYVYDACIDLNDDKRYYKYNPFLNFYGAADEKERFLEILQMLMGNCVYEFDKLPLVLDVPVLQNILCYGVWAKFNKHYNIKENKED